MLSFDVHYCHINLLKTPTLSQILTLTPTLTLTLILSPKHYTAIITRILLSSAYTLFNVIR